MARIRLGKIPSEVTPPSGQVSLYAKSDDNLYIKLESGLEFQILNSGTPGATGYSVEIIQISPAQALAKEIELLIEPSAPENTLLDVDGGGSAFYTLDFTVSGNVLSWSGGRLDGLLSSGDRLRVVYF